ncbi:hypothetical protein LTR17_025103 [Elasticomyces elasticus]|nr:hypothetical protein LTR17_025103 [Elasticomyces elasticus]
MPQHTPARHPSQESLPVTSTREQQSRLLELPAELRTQILELLLIARSSIAVSNSGSRQPCKPATQPAISRTNRQLRHESLPIFYSANTFVLRYQLLCEWQFKNMLIAAHTWLCSMTSKQRAMLRKLVVCTHTELRTIFMLCQHTVRHYPWFSDSALPSGLRLIVSDDEVEDGSCSLNQRGVKHYRVIVQEGRERQR